MLRSVGKQVQDAWKQRTSLSPGARNSLLFLHSNFDQSRYTELHKRSKLFSDLELGSTCST